MARRAKQEVPQKRTALLAQKYASQLSSDEQTNAANQIRNLFANKDDTACETHDLLACDCGPSTVPETMDDEEAADSDDDLPSIDSAFVKASQYTSSAKEVRTLHDVGGN